MQTAETKYRQCTHSKVIRNRVQKARKWFNQWEQVQTAGTECRETTTVLESRQRVLGANSRKRAYIRIVYRMRGQGAASGDKEQTAGTEWRPRRQSTDSAKIV